MNLFYKRALEIQKEIKKNRRTIHGFAETGFELPKTTDYVMERLESYGLSPKKVGRSGITCTIGKEGKVFLLRADMDALPMKEETGLPFASENGNCHSCGHDCHTAMLLAAAKMLKEQEHLLNGTVKLMFQPAEELLAGAKDMIEAGILENPHVDAAMALHVNVGAQNSEVGEISYARGSANYSGDAVKITITGKNAHGSMPELGVDAISIASHVVIALQEIISREISCTDLAVLIVGKITGGDTCNTLCGCVVLECSIRATTFEMRAFLKQRVKEIAENTAKTFRGTANVEFVYGMPPMVTDLELSDKIGDYCKDIVDSKKIHIVSTTGGTEDFAAVSEKVPTAFLKLGAGSPEKGHICTMHHPAMIVDETALPIGASLYAHCAVCYLK